MPTSGAISSSAVRGRAAVRAPEDDRWRSPEALGITVASPGELTTVRADEERPASARAATRRSGLGPLGSASARFGDSKLSVGTGPDSQCALLVRLTTARSHGGAPVFRAGCWVAHRVPRAVAVPLPRRCWSSGGLMEQTRLFMRSAPSKWTTASRLEYIGRNPSSLRARSPSATHK